MADTAAKKREQEAEALGRDITVALKKLQGISTGNMGYCGACHKAIEGGAFWQCDLCGSDNTVFLS